MEPVAGGEGPSLKQVRHQVDSRVDLPVARTEASTSTITSTVSLRACPKRGLTLCQLSSLVRIRDEKPDHATSEPYLAEGQTPFRTGSEYEYEFRTGQLIVAGLEAE